MPELPEVETVVSELRPLLKNKVIRQVEVRSPKLIAVGPLTLSNVRKSNSVAAKKFAQILKGKKITGVQRRAKLIIIDIAGKFAILVHLKMTGQLIFLEKKQLNKKIKLLNIETFQPITLPSKWTHVIFTFTDGSKLFFNDLRQFGYLKLVKDSEIDQVKELNEFGPEPLKINFAIAKFINILSKRPKMKVKLFLMDPKIIAGIGNIYSDEILFFAKIRPGRIVKTLTKSEEQRLFKAIKEVLKDAVRHNGSSVGDFVRPSGAWGKYGRLHKVYGRAGLKCKVCGSIIKSMKFSGRTGSFCPVCQK
ncbi:MAG: bifunctional DNA-formamidopyrimidine glycosylase/DNA-(apurinic or apyrimidinic site) lyase [Candidatus Doudnabacteria bacterium]|nr:bifunctional DNA-formamidopyrimidine glycosylase/DNA-(apurinic or apyrimidinic site) lyase [Candidatus Doudnabacteria bacterium]